LVQVIVIEPPEVTPVGVPSVRPWTRGTTSARRLHACELLLLERRKSPTYLILWNMLQGNVSRENREVKNKNSFDIHSGYNPNSQVTWHIVSYYVHVSLAVNVSKLISKAPENAENISRL
jgi:hypothetical protein